ncbi:MAG: site-specific integrase [Bosea sp.]|uniref:site-specific integrase n=1 Tax=Bosea sp. (in: a-proteobacteria) TaxID=1871050 RepID=UPI001AC63736|nr:site-specific integrase [Bosea sp. (in: a-proteobacteria)]MBN9468972.1 site-specific integrase [Bosea sp. (in: a-proteobacteria)]
MARRSEHLLLRGNIWWLRVRVPDALRPIIGKGEIRRSLKTSDGTEAKRRVRIERIKVEAEFDDARAALERQRAAARGATAAQLTLTEEQVWALATRWFVEQERAGVTRPVEIGDEEVIQNLSEDLAHVERFDEVSATVREEVDKLLAEAGLFPGSDSVEPAWRAKLSRAVHAAMIEREKRLLNRVTGGAGVMLNPNFHGLSAATELKPVAISTVTLADLIKRYNADPTRAAPSPKTKLKQDAQARLFKDVIGGKTLVSAIGREQARKLLDTVKALPSNATKRFSKKKLTEVLEIAKAKELAPMSVTTANSYMSAFVSLLDFAVAEHIIEKNPATGLRLASDGVKRKDKRLPFAVEDLNAIFAAPLYSGCVDDGAGYNRPGPNRPRRGRFWVPLVSLYSGMRLNEVCQLSEDDIVIDDGTNIILVRSDEDGVKRVKTAAGHRFVPIHPELKRLGFLDHVAAVRKTQPAKARLFPELTTASTGYISDNFSKFFAIFLDKVGIKDSRKNFHSFRHSFRDGLRDGLLPVSWTPRLGVS